MQITNERDFVIRRWSDICELDWYVLTPVLFFFPHEPPVLLTLQQCHGLSPQERFSMQPLPCQKLSLPPPASIIYCLRASTSYPFFSAKYSRAFKNYWYVMRLSVLVFTFANMRSTSVAVSFLLNNLLSFANFANDLPSIVFSLPLKLSNTAFN